MKKLNKLIIFPVFVLLLIVHFTKTSFALDPYCPGFKECSFGQQCEKDGVGNYYCAECPRAGDGTFLCRNSINNNPLDGNEAVGDINPPAQIDTSPNAVFNFVNPALTIIYFLALIAVLAYLLYGGLKWISGGGDPKAIASAQGTITHAIVGLLLLALALPVSRVVQDLINAKDARLAAPGTKVLIYSCGDGRSSIQEQRVKCQTAVNATYPMSAETWNSLPAETRNRLCISPGECDAGCVANDRDRINDGDQAGKDYWTRCRPQ